MRIKQYVKRVLRSIPGGSRLIAGVRGVRHAVSQWRAHRRLQLRGPGVLRTTNALLRDLGARFFIDYGTLLGVVRDNAFIKGDDDIDYTVEADSVSLAGLHGLLSGAGYKFWRGFRRNGIVTELTYTFRDVQVDFFFLFKSNGDANSFAYNDFIETASGRIAQSTVSISKPHVHEIVDVSFMGETVPIPKNYQEVLACSYGNNWRTPIAKWTSADSDEVKRVAVDGGAQIIYDASQLLCP